MDLIGVVVAGCAPGEPDCAAGTIPSGIDTWFIVLVLLVVFAAVTGAALLVRRWTAHHSEVASVSGESTPRA